MIIKLADLRLFLQNFASSYELPDCFVRIVIEYIVALLDYKIKEQSAIVYPGGFLTLVMHEPGLMQGVEGVPYLQEGMKILFDVFKNENNELQVEFTEEEFSALLKTL